jgi:cell fate regulator YaaT (PSP1 superfamily)
MACNGCASKQNGGCNRLNTFDWLSAMHIDDPIPFKIVEVSFKDGARKGFFFNQDFVNAITGDQVVVESKNGYDIGKVSLSGELVRLQMSKKRVAEEKVIHKIVRIATERDLERQKEVRAREMQTMIRARAIARTLDLEMKIGDVEYQADGRKATFFYTADGRVDFRELIRHYAREFKVKIEMRQIGARQESSRIGGVGSCGRELCCSTWLTNFKSVSTAAARYQNLAINQAKLSGQCGRLKCCLNYELDTYMDALTHFPKNAEKIQTESGLAVLVKTDIFKQLMYYAYRSEKGRGRIFGLKVETVKEILELNKAGNSTMDLSAIHYVSPVGEEDEFDFDDDVTGVIELPAEKKNRRRGRRSGGRGRRNQGVNRTSSRGGGRPQQKKKTDSSNKNTQEGKKGDNKQKDTPGNKDNKSSRGRNNRGPNRNRQNKNKKK